jgi:hypothetical protein
MRPQHEIERVLSLARSGHTNSDIARRTGVSRTTVRGWVARSPRPARDALTPVPVRPYAYLLGLYLGDGSISAHARGVFRLRITLDRSYPAIVAECEQTMRAVVPRNRVTVCPRVESFCVDVGAYSKRWPALFPQHGPGKKADRLIALSAWQRWIVESEPKALIRGLIHSDGSRFVNRIRHGAATYAYPRYTFTNTSADIRRIFCDACDRLGIVWTAPYWKTVSVARRSSVERLDGFVGPKS